MKVVANFLIMSGEFCDAKQMANSAKQYFWSAQDYSEDDMTIEKFLIAFNKEDQAKEFIEKFQAARVFNEAAKDGKDDDLVWADVVEDEKEIGEKDIDTNTTADVDGDQ